MTCRRKTCNERALVADIRKTFTVFCQNNECLECKYSSSDNCIVDYIIDLLKKEGE